MTKVLEIGLPKRKIALLYPRQRGFATATNDWTNFFDYCEEYEIQCYSWNDFFSSGLYSSFTKEDVVIVYVNFNKEDLSLVDKFKSMKCTKILRPCDAFNSDGYPYRKTIETSKTLEIEKWITSFNLDKLNTELDRQGIEYGHCPMHMLDFSDAVKNFDNKQFHIGVSGHMGWEVYPTRTRIFDYLSRWEKDNLKISYLPHPGYEKQSASHQVIGKDYIDFLSSSCLNVTCRGGWRDIMTCKYIEIGKALSLPICDIPFDLPEEMRSVVIEVKHNDTNYELKEKIYSSLEDSALKERTLEYQSLCIKYFDYKVLMPKFLSAVEDLC
tara:strand:+ start:634 stop:1611 length:978 start_codon:yes stop_codon:yes gene_type:complete